ncbi:hypothetical protein ABIA32_000704 [Streptacidiphilus sp. MAP12-20]|uniref:DUF4129 domain-containing protein n=1 Tax=Streptacidiphilus sp. MAP12-20 TaxID=3156299 RepID=UPI0035155990
MASGKDRRGLGLRLGAVLVAAATLALAAVALHAARGTALAGVGPAKAHWLIVLAVVGAAGWLLAARMGARKDRAQAPPPLESRIDSLVVPGLVLMTVVTAVGLAVLGLQTRGVDQLPQPQPVPAVSSSAQGSQAPPSSFPVQQPDLAKPVSSSPISLSTLLLGFAWLLGAAALVVLIVVLVRWMLTRRGGDAQGIAGEPVDGADEALADAVNAGQQALADDPDPRAAIIACYAAMEVSLAESGVSREKADTPTELLQRAVDAGLVQGEAARTLTELFREARYSTHPMREHQRDQARAALETIAAHLAAAAAEAADRFGPLEELQV